MAELPAAIDQVTGYRLAVVACLSCQRQDGVPVPHTWGMGDSVTYSYVGQALRQQGWFLGKANRCPQCNAGPKIAPPS